MDYRIDDKKETEDGLLEVTGTVAAGDVADLRKMALVEFMRQSGIEKGTPDTTWKTLVDGLGEEEAQDMIGKFAISRIAPFIISSLELNTMFMPEPESLGNIMDDADFPFKVSFALKPLLELSSYDPVEVSVMHEEVTDAGVSAEINDQLENIANKTDAGKSLSLTDDLVKEHFGSWAQTADEFREVVRTRLQQMKDDSFEPRVRDAVLDKITKRLEGEVPEILNRKSQQEALANMQAQLDAHNTTLEEYLGQSGMDDSEFDLVIALDAANAVRQELALDAVFRHFNLEVTDQDREETLRQIAPGMEDEARADLDASNTWYAIDSMAAQNKALEYMRASAVVTQV